MLDIRPASFGDAASLSSLGSETFVSTYSEILPDKKEIAEAYAKEAFQISKIQQELRDPKIHYFLAYLGSHNIGYAKLVSSVPTPEVKLRPSLELERIYLLFNVHGKGLGRSFLQEMIRWAHRSGAQSLWLAVFEENQPAIQFYEKSGFKKIGTREFKYEWKGQAYRDQDVLMELVLS